MNTQSTIKGVVISLAGYFSIAMLGSCVKALPSVPLPQIIFFQFLIPLFFIVPHMGRNGLQQFKTTRPKLILLRAVINIAAVSALFIAVRFIPLVDAVLLQNTSPFFVPFILWFMSGKLIRPVLWLGIGLGFLGVLFILKPGAGLLNPAAMLGLLAGILSAGSMVVISLLKTTEPTSRIVFYCSIFGALISLPFAIMQWVPLTGKEWMLLLCAGLFMYLSQMWIAHAFAFAGTQILAPMCYSAVVFSGLLGWLFWGHMPDMMTFIGIALVIGAGILTIKLEQGKNNSGRRHCNEKSDEAIQTKLVEC